MQLLLGSFLIKCDVINSGFVNYIFALSLVMITNGPEKRGT
jgi:hypothetical protein